MNATPDATTGTPAAGTGKLPIVLIHGLWMTPASWETWAERFRAAGHEVIVPGWPGIDDRSVQDVRSNPEPLKGIGLKQIADHYERIIRTLPVKPIIMGHSFGGVLTQMLADRGLGAAYVAVAPGQTAGITTLPASTLRTGFPILSNPFGRNGAKPISKAHFHFTFGNDLPRAASDALWEQFAVPSYNRVFFEGVASVPNEKGGVTHVDYARADRAPLLVITGGIDHVVPPAIGKAIVKKYTASGSPAVVEYKEYDGRTHRLVSQPGWEEIADHALTWATTHATIAA
ncbi:alpha-beta hydrolase superfamily lysophospholipase [Promicromonospora sp. AC04]|uniref:alpha/beta hydrolase n=1 Tax=Promicromonospora sp. AC04 TaxID=2135723 RepID=UPI000D39708C|nr:alpha/beta fold hydrolase [Promicromonospora sp. AC04]PUB32056.1 alpha-beta hydrolase superfamily lysophospholipase [Promicromonospora sp. AC04]